ncbi:MAG: hypothetical protein ACI4U4_04300 [Bacilli bacterium]
MILYKEDNEQKVAYIRCDCMIHGIEISKIKNCNDQYDNEICLSMYTDNFYSKQISI